MAMCLLLREPAFSLRERTFAEIWNDVFPSLTNRMRRGDHPCNRCTLITLCGLCPGWSLLEKGDMEAPVEWGCELGHRLAGGLGFRDGSVGRHSTPQGTGSKRDAPAHELEAPIAAHTGGYCG
jgi:radical SAM protein with 4Fe4S-binding SPASM domain